MTFYVDIDGKELTDGISVFPFSFGQLLDERLDEAYLHITKSAVPVYKPTTPVKVTVWEDDLPFEFDYVVASDNAYELPVGSGQYKHNIHLIEATKMLEGIYCQSITFTNSLGNNYTAGAINAKPVGIEGSFSWTPASIVNRPFYAPPPSFSFDRYKTPQAYGQSLQILSINDVAAKLISDVIAPNYSGYDVSLYTGFDSNTSTRLTVISEDETINIQGNGTSVSDPAYTETPVLSNFNSLIIEYKMCFKIQRVDIAGTTTTYEVYAFSYNVLAVTNTLPLKPLTVTDCINRVLDLAEPRFGDETPRYFLNADQAYEFDKILAPEFTMTQCTLREQLKVIGGFIHGEPRLRPSGEIYYEMYGNATESAEIDAQTPYVYRGVSHDISQYCTQIDTSASNIVNALNYAQGVVFSPDRQNYRTVRTESVNVRVTETNGYADTDFKVQDVIDVKCVVYGANGDVVIPIQDISPYVFSETEYQSRLSSFGGGYPKAKSFGIYYTIGQKGIRGLFFKEDSVDNLLYPYLEYYAIVNIIAAASGMAASAVRDAIDGDYTRVAFRISYIPIYNTRFSHGKQMVEDGAEYTQIYNQQENLIETRYYGENVKGVAARLGNVEQTRTYIFKTISQIPKAGQMLNVGTEDKPDYYAISAVNTEIMPTYYKTTVALTKDFNRISEYVGISSNKRVYEVSEREAYARNILLKEYAIVGRRPRNGYSYTPGIFRDPWGIASAFNPSIKDTAGNEASPISSVWAWGGTYVNPYQTEAENGNPPLPLVSLPVISSAFGNSMVFSWCYKDNYSAGVRLTERTSGDVSGWWQQDVAYGDTYGKMYFYNFFLLDGSADAETGRDFYISSPSVETDSFSYSRGRSDIRTEDDKPYRIRKDSREILNFNFEIEFKSNCKNLIIGSGLASASRLVSAINGGYAVIYRFTDEYGRVGKFDRQFIPHIGIGGGSPIPGMQISVDGNTIKIPLPEETQYSKHWVITTPYTAGTPYEVEDEQGNVKTYTPHTGGEILLACDNPYELYKELGGNTIYINLSKTQKEE